MQHGPTTPPTPPTPEDPTPAKPQLNRTRRHFAYQAEQVLRELGRMVNDDGVARFEITAHQVNDCNDALYVETFDEPGPGGAYQAYRIYGLDHTHHPSILRLARPMEGSLLLFQSGDPAKVGTNGLTHEVLLAIIAHRLASFQVGPFACQENGEALMLVMAALSRLKDRTERRMAEGTEGRVVPDATPPADDAESGLPRWRCHKVVQAAKIEEIRRDGQPMNGARLIFTPTGAVLSRFVCGAWLDRHNPQVGGYFVIYDDGYESYSPPEAFESGYTPVEASRGILRGVHEVATGRDLVASPDESHAREHPAN